MMNEQESTVQKPVHDSEQFSKEIQQPLLFPKLPMVLLQHQLQLRIQPQTLSIIPVPIQILLLLMIVLKALSAEMFLTVQKVII